MLNCHRLNSGVTTVSSATTVPTFGLDAAQLAALSERAVTKSFPRLSVIVNEGDPTDAIYIILEGRVRIFLADDKGKEVTLNVQGPGEYFGELTLDGGPRSASVMTLEPSRFMIIPRESLESFFANYPDFAMHLVHKLISRVRVLTERVKSLALQDVYGRLRGMLEELAVEQDGQKVVEGRMTQSDIAARIGASREMVSRILSDLKTGGYVTQGRHRIIIHRKLPADW